MNSMYPKVIRLKAHSAEVFAYLSRADGAEPRPKCLLLHGNPGTLDDWRELVPLLEPTVDLTAIDLPGFGRSPRPGPDASSLGLDRLASVTVSVADVLGWTEPFFVVGHSHGGGVALSAAAAYPGRVAGIVCLGSLGAPAHNSYRLLALPGMQHLARALGKVLGIDSLRPLLRLAFRQAMKDVFAPQPVPAQRLEHELTRFSTRPELLSSMVQVTRGNPCQSLRLSAAHVRCPVLFVHGRKDALVPVACPLTIHDAIAAAGGRSSFVVLEGAGHMLIEQQAAEVAGHITQFVLRRPNGDRVASKSLI